MRHLLTSRAFWQRWFTHNTSENPTPGIRNINIKISDDKGLESSQISKNIDVSAANDKPNIDFDGAGSLSDGDAGGALFVSGCILQMV